MTGKTIELPRAISGLPENPSMCVQGKGAFYGAPTHRDLSEVPQADQEAAQIAILQEFERCFERILDVEIRNEEGRAKAEGRAQSCGHSDPKGEQALV